MSFDFDMESDHLKTCLKKSVIYLVKSTRFLSRLLESWNIYNLIYPANVSSRVTLCPTQGYKTPKENYTTVKIKL